MDQIAHDLRLAGGWGGHSYSNLIRGKLPIGETTGGVFIDNCDADGNWAADLDRSIKIADDAVGSTLDCLVSPKDDADILEVRYANPNPVVALEADTAYIQSNYSAGELFIGSDAPTDLANSETYELVSNVYYISETVNEDDSDFVLRRLSLSAGGGRSDDVLLDNVEDLQVQLGVDSNGDEVVDFYYNPSAVSDDVTVTPNFTQVRSAQIWGSCII